jgi:hypothetical protein
VQPPHKGTHAALFIREGRNAYRDDTINDSFYYACIYDLLGDQNGGRGRNATIKFFKAKILQIHSRQLHILKTRLRIKYSFQQRIMVLGSTQPLTEMSTMCILGVNGGQRARPSVSRLSRKCGSLHDMLQGKFLEERRSI